MNKRAVTFFVLAFLCAANLSLALEVPDRPDDYISDRAGIFKPDTAHRLNRLLSEYETQTSNQIFIAAFPTLEEESLEDFSIRLAEKWKIGQKGKDNGVIILVFKNERKIRIETGYGLEGSLTDALSARIIRDEMAPSFSKGNYSQGILNGVSAIAKAIKGEYTRGVSGAEIDRKYLMMRIKEAIPFILIFFVLLLLITTVVDLNRYGKYRYTYRVYRDLDTFPRWWVRSSSLWFILLWTFRVAMEVVYYTLILSLFRGGGYGMGSGGRRGGFGGGGRFGGGGASGGW
ncbi:MAG: TPM domain-containing protein [Candidatus Omnitrophota bacterium]